MKFIDSNFGSNCELPNIGHNQPVLSLTHEVSGAQRRTIPGETRVRQDVDSVRVSMQ